MVKIVITNGRYQYKLLKPIKKGIEDIILAQAFLEFVRMPAIPIENKKKSEEIIFSFFFVFSNKSATQNGKTRENQLPA